MAPVANNYTLASLFSADWNGATKFGVSLWAKRNDWDDNQWRTTLRISNTKYQFSLLVCNNFISINNTDAGRVILVQKHSNSRASYIVCIGSAPDFNGAFYPEGYVNFSK